MVVTGTGLVGRDAVLAVLGAVLDSAMSRRAQLVLVTGDAGIGKTAVAGEVARTAVSRGALALWGRCAEGEGVPPYWPWTQVLRGAVETGVVTPDGAARSLMGGHSDPAERQLLDAPGEMPARARFRLFDSVTRLLAAIAGEQAVVLFFEDLHWADDASLRLLEFAARQLGEARVLLVGTYRDVEAGDSLRRVAGAAQVVPLEGLTPVDVARLMTALAGQPPSDAVATAMCARTGGNPLFVRELTRLQLAREGSVTSLTGVGVVDSVRDTIERRLARLSQPCIALLQLAALDGMTVRPMVLSRALRDGEELSVRIDEAVSARVLIVDATDAQTRFAHDLFREVLTAAMPGPMRAREHLRIAHALESLQRQGEPVPAAELSAHFSAAIAAEPAAAAAAVEYGLAAAFDASTHLAFEDAVALLERVLTVLDTRPDPDATQRMDVLLALAESRRQAGRLAQARATFFDAADAAQRLGDSGALARAAIGVHSVSAKTGASPERERTVALLEEAVRRTDGQPANVRARVQAALARDLYFSLEPPRMRRAERVAREAAALARASGDASVLSHCLVSLHDVNWRPGAARARLDVLDELLALAGSLDAADLMAQAHLLRSTAFLELGDARAHHELDVYCRDAERLGDAASRWSSLSRRASAALLRGMLDRAEELIDAAGALAQQTGDADALWVHDIQRWELARFRGGRGGFRRLRPHSEPDVETWAPWPALIAAEAGEVESAAAVLSAAPVAQLAGPGATEGYDLWFPAIAAEAAARCGSDELRAALYERLAPFAGTHVVCGAAVAYDGAIDHYLGLLAAALGRHREAAEHFDHAVSLHQRLGAPGWVTLSRAELGELAFMAVSPGVSNRFHADESVWTLTFGGRTVHLADAKGLRDIASLLARPGEFVSTAELAGAAVPAGADPVLDVAARAAYRSRLHDLDHEIDDAAASHDTERAARAAGERDALIDELRRAAGIRGRQRRLGDDGERMRKAVSARIHHAIERIGAQHAALAEHLRLTIRTGASCAYQPPSPVEWDL